MILVRNKYLSLKNSQGYSLVELAVAISLVGILFYSSTQLTHFTGLFFRRMKTASLYQYQVAPIDLLQRSQIRQCQYAAYPDRATALSQLPSDRTPTGVVLRCNRYDGNGWFLLVWEDATKTLWLEPGDSTSLNSTTGSYPFASLSSLLFDVSQGTLQTFIQITAPMDYTLKSSNPHQPVTLQYVLVTSSQF